jgi:hypothetical protein
MKGVEMNLKVMMILVLLVISIFLIYGLVSDNVSFLTDFGNQTINGSMGFSS